MSSYPLYPDKEYKIPKLLLSLREQDRYLFLVEEEIEWRKMVTVWCRYSSE